MSSPARFCLFAALVLILLLASCARSEEPVGTDGDSSTGPMEGESSSMALTDEGRARAPSDEDGGETPAQPILDPRESAFAGQRMRAVAIDPIDFYIGRVGSPPSGLPAAAWRSANEVLRLLLIDDREIEHPVLSPSDRRALVEIMASAPFESVRLARPVVLSDQSYSMEFRLFGGDNNIIGEIVVDLQNEEWYSAGIQARPSALVRRRFAPNVDVPGLVW